MVEEGRRGFKRGFKQGISLTEFNDEEFEKLTVRDYFIKYLFTDAIIYGMSYDEFWNKDPELFFSYRFSYLKRIEIQREEINFGSWLNGLYNYKAYAVALHNAFDGKNAPLTYFTEPIDLNGDIKEENKEEAFIEKRTFWSRFKEKFYRSRKE